MTSLRFVLPLACLLCLTCSVSAQNFTASTPFANLTLVAQVNSNFSANVATPSFPCDNSSPGLVGGYSDLDQDDEQAGDDLYYISNAVFNYYLYATANFTGCSVLGDSSFNASRACSQVVSGTNYAVELEIISECLSQDNDSSIIDTATYLPLRATVYVPIQDAAFNTYEAASEGPQIKDIWFDATPELLATNETAAEAEPEPEAEAPSAALSPPSSGDTLTTNLLTGSTGVGSSTGTLQFSSPEASPAAESAPAAESEVVSGISTADQERSIKSG